MPYLVNGQPVPEEIVREEFGRIGRDPQWQAIADPACFRLTFAFLKELL